MALIGESGTKNQAGGSSQTQEQLPYGPALERLAGAERVLLALPERFSEDHLAAALAVKLLLERAGKHPAVATSGALPEYLKFLPGSGDVVPGIPDGESFVVTLDTSTRPLDELSYEAKDGLLKVYLKAKSGMYAPSDVTFGREGAFDTVATFGCRSLEDLGGLFELRAPLFYDAVKVNFDNHPENTYFGALNLVDIKALSLCEIVLRLFEPSLDAPDGQDVATCLLTGLIASSRSFKHPQTTPQLLLSASELVAAGGRQQDVVRALYKTKTLSQLKLWGRALARLQHNHSGTLAYAVLTVGDFEKSGASVGELRFVLRDLLDYVGQPVLAVALIAERGGGSQLAVALHRTVNRTALTSRLPAPLEPEGTVGLYETFSVQSSTETPSAVEAALLEVGAQL